jgi:GT2 family glycosyltransferase
LRNPAALANPPVDFPGVPFNPDNAVATALRKRVRADGKLFARGDQRLRICGVTYGPFSPNIHGEPYPSADRVADDFAKMRAAGINAVRTYHMPPEWLLRQADEQDMALFVDVPWSKHLCFLNSERARREARLTVRQAAEHGRHHPSVLAYSVANEIPTNIIRWHGARRIERFLRELYDVSRQADPDGLVTYASFPPTEFLDLSAFDFVTFNVYLHDLETFRRYLCRLQNLVGDKPLVLGELGMDTIRHGEIAQADFLSGHLREAALMGLAGAFIFSWTDDWFTGGHAITNWAFGITDRKRFPKAASHAVREVFESAPAALLSTIPRVSVIVCTYNGGATLDSCLSALRAVDYPDYEVIVVDDGSTDDTRAILTQYPEVRAIHQPNRGLSTARNVGLQAATGSVIAYTDSDCFVDSDWLTHLVHQLTRSGAAAAGGPNLTPPDGRLAACVAASPGQPTHVLESDQVAEHVPGCNMAFHREALEAINGFDPQYRKAGDDVDVCWRLQQAGYWITYAAGAFVWHRRRQTPRAYLRQQAGYGEAEALLQFKHPDKFTGRGDGKWRGVMYGAGLQGLRLRTPIIFRGTYGTGMFQCLYQPGPAHWAMLPSTLEWHLIVALAAMASLFWPLGWIAVGLMLALSLAIAAAQAIQANLPSEYRGLWPRVVVCALCYAQPLVRSWSRYRTRLLSYPRHGPSVADRAMPAPRFPFRGSLTCEYWTETGWQRTELLSLFAARSLEHGWGIVVDSGWADWDLEIHYRLWTLVRVYTAQEDHGGCKHLIRVRFELRPTAFTKLLTTLGVLASTLALGIHPLAAAAGFGLLLAGLLAAWRRGTSLAGIVACELDDLAYSQGVSRCERRPGANLNGD